ncbi:MAG: L,D-transpeptidase [Parachlamydiaceae bacterium]|nr:L,D-transpeptidase [Parachlamydiaceae bacterium]
MTYPKLLALVTFLLFALIAVLAFMKGGKSTAAKEVVLPAYTASVPIKLGSEVREIKPSQGLAAVQVVQEIQKSITEPLVAEKKLVQKAVVELIKPEFIQVKTNVKLPEADRIAMLFNKVDPKFPFIETVTYKSRVAWQKGRPAWLSDYAAYYSTSRHFIARSLNGNKDYNKQDLAEGDRFNVFRKDKNIAFHLLVDLGRCRLWLYGIDTDKQERYLIKTYTVGVGRTEENRASGLLTPLGTYGLGDKIAIYKPKMQGFYNGKKVEMLRIFGTRWIPFDKEIKGCTAPAKSLGIHGVPCQLSPKGDLVEDLGSLGKYESDGCIHLSTDDMEEVFAIIITKPASIELVADFTDAQLPGKEWN